MAEPAISILTPFLNAGPFLAEAIASVRDQGFEDWELLLIDDGSGDESVATAQVAAAADIRIRLIPAPSFAPSGAAAARNRGLAQARAPLVTFLDADDRFEPGMLARHVELMGRHPQAAMAYGPTRWWYPDDPSMNRLQDMGDLAGRTYPAPMLLEKVILLCDSPVPCTCGITVRRDIIRGLGGFDEGFRLYEDQTAWARIMLNHPVHVDDVPTALYRQHGASVSAGAIATGDYDAAGDHPARNVFLDWIEAMVAGRPDAARLRRTITRARWQMRQQGKGWYRGWRRLRRLALRLRAARRSA